MTAGCQNGQRLKTGKRMREEAMQPLFGNSRRWLALAAWVTLCLTVGFVIGFFFKPGAWYAGLEKPVFNPPAWLFAPVWTVLYVAMGVAAWRVWSKPDSVERKQALRQFCVQLALNAAWPPIFFGAQSLSGGLAVIVCMLFAIAATIQQRRRCLKNIP